jgi:hypothetical protein
MDVNSGGASLKAKRRTRTAPQPLSEAIAKDARNKRALNKQFFSFYKQMKRAISFSPELKELDVPLEKVKESVKLAAHGEEFGDLLVRLVKPKS